MSVMVAQTTRFDRALFVSGAWVLAIMWVLPLAWAIWTAIHPPAYVTRINLFAPLTTQNFVAAWNAAPFGRYLFNTIVLVTMILGAQLLLCIHAAFAFARLNFPGKNILFALVLVQLMVTPDILLVRNYATIAQLGLLDTIPAIGLPYFASAFPVAADLQDHSHGTRRCRARRRCDTAGPDLARLRAACQAHDPGLCAGFGQQPLEQFPLAADRDLFGQHAPPDRRPVDFRHH